ncbi:hypothetical protein GF389_02900 [Candidatus Dojkabacteria bacterium]|nr:hypothetical protein [Candidatus Dojkabacteria bacterium]
MNTITKETQSVYDSIKEYEPVRPSELVELLGISTKNVYKHLARLLEFQKVQKLGETPVVYYSTNKPKPKTINTLDTNDLLIEYNYLYVDPTGRLIPGMEGFRTWVRKNKFDLEKQKKAYVKSLGRLSKYIKNVLISAKGRILNGKKKIALSQVYYNNFYTFDHFGKTKLGQLVYVGKSSQNRELISEIVEIVKPSIENLIRKHKIGYVGFIPPTVDRKMQFVEVFEDLLDLKFKRVEINKVASKNKLPQKSLRKLEDRVINAKKTIAVDPTQKIDKNVLLIDDAAGSGATLNETAKKVKKIAEPGVKVYGYAVVGSYKGFDVISEV